MVFPYRPNEKPIRIQINKQSYTGQAIFKVFVSFHKVRTFIKYAFHGQNVSRMSYYKMTTESSKFYYITQNNLFINNRILKYFWVLKTGKVWSIDLWKLERFYWALILISVPIICVITVLLRLFPVHIFLNRFTNDRKFPSIHLQLLLI